MKNTNQIIPTNQGIAYILAAIFVLCPLYAYRDVPELFGSAALFHLSLITAFGGGISTVAYFYGQKIIPALTSGVVGGASQAFIYSAAVHNASITAFTTQKLLLGITFIISLSFGYIVLLVLRKVFKEQSRVT
jgi:hypothetical protein